MEVIICATEGEVGRIGAAKVAKVAQAVGPSVVIGVATGSSPLACYAELARREREGQIDLSAASAFALDEYVGLPKGHPESYAEVIRRTVTEPLGLDPDRVHVPDGFAADLAAAGPAYEAAIKAAGGIDVQILGIGSNGHVGFNEPTSSLASRTRVKTLAECTRRDNARFFSTSQDVPRHCLTQGLGTIMDARTVVLMASGPAKARAIAEMVEGPIAAMCPGSVLQLHQHATVVIDEAAASELQFADYYRQAFDWLPQWQRLDV